MFSLHVSHCGDSTNWRLRLRCSLGFVGAALVSAELLLAGGGCDKAPELPTVSAIQQAVTQQVEEIKRGKPAQIQVQLDKAYQTTDCRGAIFAFESPRQLVFQVNSSDDAAAESFPSFFAQAFLSGASEIAPGKLLQARIYFQANPNAVLWETPPGELAELTITAATDSSFEAEIAGNLISSEDGLRQALKGTLCGSMTQLPAK